MRLRIIRGTPSPFRATDAVASFRALVFAALIAGIAAGGATSVVQALRLWPLIAAAEELEDKAPAAGQGHDASHAHSAPGWSPQGPLRPMLTVVFNMAAGVGFALMLNAVARLRGVRTGVGLTVRDGLAWGAVGFAAFALAPALGLPPALPGMAEGGLLARQAWWLGTAVATLCGIAMVAWVGAPWRWGGILLLVLPHVVGAPAMGGGAVPGEMAAAFVAGSLAASAVFWVVLGGVSGWAQARMARG